MVMFVLVVISNDVLTENGKKKKYTSFPF